MKFDLGWGESVAVRKAFLDECRHLPPVLFSRHNMDSLGYPAHEGDPALIELTRKLIKRHIGKEYSHVLITNGATGGVTVALRSFAGGFKACVTRQPPYFRLYPSMIEAAGLFQLHPTMSGYLKEYRKELVYLVDSISNPTSEFSEMKRDAYNNPIVWDAVYFGKVYAPGNHPQPEHDILVGSYSKLTGLNGLRIGWIACNDFVKYNNMKRLVTAEYCGVSAASGKIILDTAGQFREREWAAFERNAVRALDDNRTEFSKLEKYFGQFPVSKYGMFYYAPIDDSCRKLLEKSEIVWSPGKDLGTDSSFGRFNIGQDVQVVKEAVATILWNDKR